MGDRRGESSTKTVRLNGDTGSDSRARRSSVFAPVLRNKLGASATQLPIPSDKRGATSPATGFFVL
jgi:hypothetical protein